MEEGEEQVCFYTLQSAVTVLPLIYSKTIDIQVIYRIQMQTRNAHKKMQQGKLLTAPLDIPPIYNECLVKVTKLLGGKWNRFINEYVHEINSF